MQNIVGTKPLVGRIAGIVLNVGVDIWWFLDHGADLIFWLFAAFTLVQVVQAVLALRKNISVENSGVVINGTTIPYSSISDVKVRKGFLFERRVTVETVDGKSYPVPVNNPQEVSDAILGNRAASVSA